MTNSGRSCAVVVMAILSTAAMPPISGQARAAIDRIVGAKGVYAAEESAYKFVFPRLDVSVRVGQQRLSPAQAPQSWATFQPSMHQEGIVNGELVLLDDEVNPVLSAALKAGLQVTGLGPTLMSEPRLYALNVMGEGTFQTLATALRSALDEGRRIRAQARDVPAASAPIPPVRNAIDAAPLNAILSMRGTAVEGIYRAAIGRVALVNGTPIGREMGMSLKTSIFGTNDRAFIDADMIVSHGELQRVLTALRARNLSITAIRNHIVGEHPPAIFVRIWGQGAASELARGLRSALDVQVGIARPAPP